MNESDHRNRLLVLHEQFFFDLHWQSDPVTRIYINTNPLVLGKFGNILNFA